MIVRYGDNFRGVKSFVAEEHGAAGVIIYSDPIDDGYFRGDAYPKGPWRPESGVQRGSIQYMFQFPGDPTTPGFASVVSLPDATRCAGKIGTLPRFLRRRFRMEMRGRSWRTLLDLKRRVTGKARCRLPIT